MRKRTSQPRQKHIPVTLEKRRELDRFKRDYEEATGDSGDWGKFLTIVGLAALAALEVYPAGRLQRLSPIAWRVSCDCGMSFPVQVPNPPFSRLAQLACPNCSHDLVVDFGKPTASSLAQAEPYEAFCRYCQQPIQVSFSQGKSGQIRYMECARCGRIPKI